MATEGGAPREVRRRRLSAADFLSVPTDAELVERVTGGEVGAFEQLYRRHCDAAWRVAQAVTGNNHDAADAVAEAFARVLQALPAGRLAEGVPFRPYVLAATRNAAIDTLRRSGRTQPTDQLDHLDDAGAVATPSERVEGHDDAEVAARAFRDLPERWRTILWLTEVEGMPAREAGPLLGLSANGAAQLAVRARAGLRERYLQAHVRNHARPACLFTVDHLGAYVGGGLAPRDIAKVDQHLAGCEECCDRLADVQDLGRSLRRVIVPNPLGVGVLALQKWKLAAVGHGVLSVARAAAIGGRGAIHVQRALAGVAACVLGLGAYSLLPPKSQVRWRAIGPLPCANVGVDLNCAAAKGKSVAPACKGSSRQAEG